MKQLFFSIVFICIVSAANAQTNNKFINPTGTYKLTTHNPDKNYYGEVFVKLLSNSKIAIALYICMGGHALNNGTLKIPLTM